MAATTGLVARAGVRAGFRGGGGGGGLACGGGGGGGGGGGVAAGQGPSVGDFELDLTSSPLLQAGTLEEAADALAGERLREVAGSAAFVQTPSGLGAAASASAMYDTAPAGATPSVRAAALERRRLAAARAHAEALRRLAVLLNGAMVQSEQTIAQATSTGTSTGASTGAGASATVEQREVIRREVEALLRGAAVYDVQDRPGVAGDQGEVVVSVITSPRTRGAGAWTTGGGYTTADVNAAREALIAELRKGVTPPVGGRVLTSPTSGETVWVGFGTSPIAGPQAALRESAQRIAEQRAEASLVALLRGQRIESDAQVEQTLRQAFDLNASVTGSGPSATDLLETVSREDTRLAAEGRVPPGAGRVSFVDESGSWAVHAVWYGATGSPLDVAPPAWTGAGAGAAPVASEAPLAAPGPLVSPAPGVSAGNIPQACAAEFPGVVVVQARGEGPTRTAAIADALASAVRQVRGVTVEANGSTRTEYERIARLSEFGEDGVSGQNRQTASEGIEVRGGGPVRAYRIMAEGRWAGGSWVDVCVSVPDPSAPVSASLTRGPTVAVLPFDVGASAFAEGTVLRDARSLAEAFGGMIERHLLGLRSADVIDRRDLDRLVRQQDLERDLVNAGRMPAAELARFGRLIGADILVTGRVEDLRWTVERVFVPIRGVEEIQERLDVSVSVRAVESASGRVLWSGGQTRTYTPPELRQLEAQRGLRGRLEVGLAAAAENLGPDLSWTLDSRLAGAPGAAGATVLRVEGTRVLVHDPFGATRVGDRLAVIVREIHTVNGREVPSEFEVASVRAIAVGGDGRSVTAEVIGGDARGIPAGALCVPERGR